MSETPGQDDEFLRALVELMRAEWFRRYADRLTDKDEWYLIDPENG